MKENIRKYERKRYTDHEGKKLKSYERKRKRKIMKEISKERKIMKLIMKEKEEKEENELYR